MNILHRRQTVSLVGVLAVAFLFAPHPAAGGSIELGIGGTRLAVSVESYKERRFANVVQQEYDFSCGSAALATLLHYHYDRPVTEKEVFKVMYEHGDKERIRKDGFSLLDMKTYLGRQGFRSDGYRVPLAKLTETGIPAIALVTIKGYSHFVVVKGVSEREVLVGDPALGLKIMSRDDFEQAWNGIVFVVLQGAESKPRFNVAEEWDTRVESPLGEAVLRNSLAQYSIGLPALNHF